MKRKNWMIVNEEGLVYTGDVGCDATGWSMNEEDAVLFSARGTAESHMNGRTAFDGCSVKEAR